MARTACHAVATHKQAPKSVLALPCSASNTIAKPRMGHSIPFGEDAMDFSRRSSLAFAALLSRCLRACKRGCNGCFDPCLLSLLRTRHLVVAQQLDHATLFANACKHSMMHCDLRHPATHIRARCQSQAKPQVSASPEKRDGGLHCNLQRTRWRRQTGQRTAMRRRLFCFRESLLAGTPPSCARESCSSIFRASACCSLLSACARSSSARCLLICFCASARSFSCASYARSACASAACSRASCSRACFSLATVCSAPFTCASSCALYSAAALRH